MIPNRCDTISIAMKQASALSPTAGTQVHNTDRNLCLKCGLCCDGTLFYSVAIDVERDDETFALLGVSTAVVMGEVSVLHPCAAHVQGVCTIYHDRPHICRTYQCKLLQEMKKDTISWELACALVAETKQHRDRIAQRLSPWAEVGPGTGLSAAYRLFSDSHAGEADRTMFLKKHGDIVLDYGALLIRLRKHFLHRNVTEDAEPMPTGV